MTDEEVIERLRRAEEEDIRQDNKCMEELKSMGLIRQGFGDRTRRQWVTDVTEVLKRYGILSNKFSRR